MINTALVGCGYWGPNLLRNLNLISNLKIVVDVNDKNFAALQEQYPNVVFSTNLDLIHTMDVKAVAIATPPNTHYDVASKLRDYHLFIEKPLTDTLENATLLCEIENKSRINCVGHVFLFSPEIKELKKLVSKHSIKSINITRLNFGKYQSCGVAVDLLPHDLSILRFLLEKELVVSKACYGQLDGVSISGCAVVQADNVDCVITSSWTNTSKVRCVTVNTDNGTFEYDMSIPSIIRHYKNRNLETNTAGQLENIEVPYADEPLLGELKYWLSLIKKPSKKNVISFKDGYEVVKLIDTIKRYA